MFHKILDRQIRKKLGKNFVIPEVWEELLEVVSETYDHYENDRVMLERSLELSSKELFEVNQSILKQRDELQTKSEALELAYQELQSTQTQLIQSEKLATLGQLVAGIAHEINTPLGAINAAASILDNLVPSVLSKQPELVKSFTPAVEAAFDEYVRVCLGSSVSLTSREERQYTKQVSEFLKTHAIENASSLATRIVKSGVIRDIEKYLPMLQHPNCEAMIETAYSIGRINININNIALAVTKTQKIVFALKSYSYRAQDEIKTKFNILDNIDTVLVLYSNQLKHDIETTVHKDVPEPIIEGFPDELHQVWTNIIYNAIQAMAGKGKLHVSITAPADKSDKVVVTIEDNGPGIPAEVLPKIFQPFFTTKKQGEGTGLGLDICKKIIDRHGGNIYVKSQPGETVFTIELPTRSASAANA